MTYNSTIRIQHEKYKPGKFKRWMKNVKRLFIATVYISVAAILINFADNSNLAFAKDFEKPVKKSQTDSAVLLSETAQINYFSGVINNPQIAKQVVIHASQFGIEPSLLAALIKVESDFNPLAINYNYNGSIDRGLCQLNNRTFTSFQVGDFYNTELNIKTGAEFLKWCIDNAENNMVVALAYYNAGYGNVTNEKVGDTTLNYINKILHHKKTYDEALAKNDTNL